MARMPKGNVMACVICGGKASAWTGYVFYEDGHSVYAAWCDNCKQDEYGNPVFENQAALDRFKREHPIIYGKRVAPYKIAFLFNCGAPNPPRQAKE